MSNDTIAGSGLEKMFYGQILSILVIIPLVGWIAAIVGIVHFDSESGGDLPGLYYHCRPA